MFLGDVVLEMNHLAVLTVSMEMTDIFNNENDPGFRNYIEERIEELKDELNKKERAYFGIRDG